MSNFWTGRIVETESDPVLDFPHTLIETQCTQMFGTVVWSGSSWSGVGEFEPRQVIIWKDQQSGTHIFRVRNTSCRRSLTVHAIAVKSSMAVLL